MISFLRFLLRILPDKLYLQLMFFKHHHRLINFKNPKSFNEKLQWLKLYNQKTEYTKMVDKFLVKEYVAKKIGREYIIPTLGVWNHADEIDFENLPNQFVLKWNHDSGSVIICRDKSNFNCERARETLRKFEKHNAFFYGREWPYKNVDPKIIAESYLSESGEVPVDYKFFCFNGTLKMYKIDFDRFSNHRANYYDVDDRLLPFGEASLPPDYTRQHSLPKNIHDMKRLASILAHKIPFLRVDFYSCNEKIYFGEMTFFPASGFGPFDPPEWDEILGKLLDIESMYDCNKT